MTLTYICSSIVKSWEEVESGGETHSILKSWEEAGSGGWDSRNPTNWLGEPLLRPISLSGFFLLLFRFRAPRIRWKSRLPREPRLFPLSLYAQCGCSSKPPILLYRGLLLGTPSFFLPTAARCLTGHRKLSSKRICVTVSIFSSFFCHSKVIETQYMLHEICVCVFTKNI